MNIFYPLIVILSVLSTTLSDKLSICEKYKECVQCRIHKSGPLDEVSCNRCSINPIGTSEFDVEEGEELCVFIEDNDCKFQFKYKYDKNEDLIYIIAQNIKECPTFDPLDQPFEVYAIIFGLIIVGIVFIFCALILFKKLYISFLK